MLANNFFKPWYQHGKLRHSLGGEVIFFFVLCSTLLLLPWIQCSVCLPDLKVLPACVYGTVCTPFYNWPWPLDGTMVIWVEGWMVSIPLKLILFDLIWRETPPKKLWLLLDLRAKLDLRLTNCFSKILFNIHCKKYPSNEIIFCWYLIS